MVQLSLSEPAASKTAELPLCLLGFVFADTFPGDPPGWDVAAVSLTRDSANVRGRRGAAEKHLRGRISTGRSEAPRVLQLRERQSHSLSKVEIAQSHVRSAALPVDGRHQTLLSGQLHEPPVSLAPYQRQRLSLCSGRGRQKQSQVSHFIYFWYKPVLLSAAPHKIYLYILHKRINVVLGKMSD